VLLKGSSRAGREIPTENSESATAASVAAIAQNGNTAVLACLLDLPRP